MPTPERASLAQVYAQVTTRLENAGVPTPGPDADALIAHVMHKTPAEVRTARARGDYLSGAHLDEVEDVVKRRVAREPLQHICGRAPFRTHELRVGPGVFVPRPETEVVAGAAIEAIRAREHSGEVPYAIDLCAGSGAIALALVRETQARVWAVERDVYALEYLRRNVADLTETERSRITVTAGDARTALDSLNGQCDVVVSNPPYIPPGATPLEPEVAHHDPQVALYGLGPDGLEIPRGVARAAARLLSPGGIFVMEHGQEQGEATRALVGDIDAFVSAVTHQDLAGRDRYLVAHTQSG